MSAWILAATMMGLAGSIHCAGMCGPIALLVSSKSGENRLGGMLLYNAGRVISYMMLGAIAGYAGQSILWFTGQQWLSIIAGTIIILSVIAVYVRIGFLKRVSGFLQERLRKVLGRVMKSRKPTTLLYMGVLNGLLPCGLVYAALGGAAATGSVTTGALFMALFGSGTIPVMLGISLAGSKIPSGVYRRMVKAVPVVMVLLGMLLIIRGAGLGIPYLSPTIECGNMACCHH